MYSYNESMMTIGFPTQVGSVTLYLHLSMQCHTITCCTYYTKVPPHSLHQQEEKTGQYKAFALTGLGEFKSQRLLSLGNKLLTGQMQLLS